MYKRAFLAAIAAALAVICPAHATVTTTTRTVSYACNGSTTVYTIPFPYASDAHLAVTSTTAGGAVTNLLGGGVDYTVSPTAAPTGGTATLIAGSRCPNASTLAITRTVPNTQTLSLRAQGPFDPKSLEKALDSLEMQIQQGVGSGGGGGGGGGVSLSAVNTWTAPQIFSPVSSGSTAVSGNGGPTSGTGLYGTGGSPNGVGVSGLGQGTAVGVFGAGGVSGGAGVSGLGGAGSGFGGRFTGGTPNGGGLIGIGTGTGPGITAQGGAGAPLNLIPQAAPSTHVNGDIWLETPSNNLKAWINGAAVTVYPQGASGISAAGNNAWTGTNTFSPSVAASTAVTGTGNTTGRGGDFTGGASSTDGVRGTGGATNGVGVVGNGAGSGTGTVGVGGATGIGVYGAGGATSGYGVSGLGTGGFAGVTGTGNAAGAGGLFIGGNTAPGVKATAGGVTTPVDGSIVFVPENPPSAPSDGACWVELGSNMFKCRISGVTQTIYPQATGAAGAMLDATTTAGQSIPAAGGADTTVVFGTVTTDTDAAYNSSTGAFTVPVAKGGHYLITSAVTYVSQSFTTVISVYINGVSSKQITGLNEAVPHVATVLNLAAGDVITIRTRHSSSGSLALSATAKANWFQVKQIMAGGGGGGSPTMISVKQYGALGDGVTDDTAAIQAALNANLDVYVPDGTYMINGAGATVDCRSGGLTPRSNSRLVLSGGATLKQKADATGIYCVLRLSGVSNVTITGGTIDGNRAGSTAGGGTQSGFPLGIIGSTNININGVTVKNAWGDGVIIDNLRAPDTPTTSQYIRINQLRSDNSRRNGMSIIAGLHMLITNSQFTNTIGTSPEAGVDIEPWDASFTVTGVVFDGCEFTANAETGISASNLILAAMTQISVVNSLVSDNPGNGLTYANVSGGVISGNAIKGNGFGGINLVDSSNLTVAANRINSISTATNGISATGASSGIEISGNVINNAGTSGIKIGETAGFPSGISIVGNTIISPQTHGIWVRNLTDGQVSNNTVLNAGQLTNATYDGLFMDTDTRVLVSGNVVRKGALTNKTRYGINSASSTDLRVVGNDFTTGGNTADYVNTSPTRVTFDGNAYSTPNPSIERGTITLAAGTGTATTFSGATCLCTDTTANASVKCAVATTTLTATGTGTDVIAYRCF